MAASGQREMRISFIGGGAMAEAMIAGILKAGLTEAQYVIVGEPVETRRDYLRATYSVESAERNADAIDGADVVVLAVKPQQTNAVLSELRGLIGSDATFLSVVGGFNLRQLVDGVGHAAVIRVMPNTPAQIGAGMSVWTATAEVTEPGRDAAGAILRSLGEEIHVPDEKLIDLATPLSGCGPAYVFLFIESLIDAGVYIGMTREMARTLALQTVLGSTKLVAESGRHAAELKDMVTSPAGATIEGVLALEQSGFRSSVLAAVIAAYDKATTLGENK